MVEFARFFERRTHKPGVVEVELRRLQMLMDTKSLGFDPYIEKTFTYLKWANRCGLDGQSVVYSCYDLALTMVPDLGGVFYQEKIERWKNHTHVSQKTNDPRTITMQLYPKYFAAILSGVKTHEGRAYDPESDKAYHNIKPGDRIFFTICKEIPGWDQECKELGLKPEMLMGAEVKEVKFAPSVHAMYQMCPGVGEEFQPAVIGPSELLNLQKAAVYYAIPGYRQKIAENGFVGIALENQKLIN